MRTIPSRPQEPSWLYVPADPVLRDHATAIEHELRRALRRPGEEDPSALDDPPERRETERLAAPDFVPLSADVAPQMSLFGGAAPAATAPRPSPAAARWMSAPPAGAAGSAGGSAAAGSAGVAAAAGAAGTDAHPPPPGPATIPAFERRSRLRDERHRLVSEVRRRDGTSHREINAWLNRKLGITSVEQATLEDLERSVALLVGKLSARR